MLMSNDNNIHSYYSYLLFLKTLLYSDLAPTMFSRRLTSFLSNLYILNNYKTHKSTLVHYSFESFIVIALRFNSAKFTRIYQYVLII